MMETRDFNPEFIFTASRSSGPGGQHVNKVSTRIELRFDIPSSGLLNEDEKKLLMARLLSRVTKNGILRIVSQSQRSQLENKEHAVARFYELIEKALKTDKPRTPTRPTKSSKIRRLENKQNRAEKKKLRRMIPDE